MIEVELHPENMNREEGFPWASNESHSFKL
jgi:hypothetical protein